MTKFFASLLLVLFLVPVASNAQVLVTTSELGNKMIEYKVEFEQPTKKSTQVFISGEMTETTNSAGEVEWANVEIFDKDGNGLYEYTFVTWNRLIKFYVSAVNIKWNPKLALSTFYDEESKCLIVGFVDHKLITKNEFKPLYPGTWGDTYIRGEDRDFLYVNCNMLSKPTVSVFAQLSSDEWKERELKIINNWGWAVIPLKFETVYWRDEEGEKHLGELRLGFGGRTPSGEIVWPISIERAVVAYDPFTKGFKIKFN